MVRGSGGSKSRITKAVGVEPPGRMRDQKMHAAVARSTFWSQNAKKPCSGQFWQLRCRKSARSCGEAHVKVKSLKTLQPRSTFRTWVAEKMHAAVAKKISKWNPKSTTVFEPFLDVQVSFFVAGARDSAPCQKWAKRVGFAAVSKTMAGVGPLKRIWTTLHYTTLHYAPCITILTSPIGFLSKFPPPPCAVLLVHGWMDGPYGPSNHTITTIFSGLMGCFFNFQSHDE